VIAPTRRRENIGRRDQFSLRSFVHNEAFGGLVLLTCALIALTWANSPWHDSYERLWTTNLSLGTAQTHMTESLRHWVNDGLMAIFFFVVGLEIKREILGGELASRRRAALPAIAALGGVVVPAGIYLAINWGYPGVRGWGVPMATDIAFALGVLALLGDRVPIGLKVFVTALAIIDDIAAVLVIAIFYTADVDGRALGAGAGMLTLLAVVNRVGIRTPWIYGLLGILLWIAIFQSGVHATVAGILLAMTIPAGSRADPADFLVRGRALLDAFERAGPENQSILANGARQEALAELEDIVEAAGAPLQRFEHALHPVVAFAIVPLFALANAGVRIEADIGATLGSRVTLGVVLGLILGKPLGVGMAALLAVRSRIAVLPTGVSWLHMFGAACVAGIGFTMSLFMAELAFFSTDESDLLTSAKLGILVASPTAGAAGWLLLSRIRSARQPV
jgi:NhaA family Na+:H+ antiporter